MRRIRIFEVISFVGAHWGLPVLLLLSLAACQPKVVKETVVVEVDKEVTRVVTEVVEERVVVNKEVTRIVVVTPAPPTPTAPPNVVTQTVTSTSGSANGIPLHAVKLTAGGTAIPSWGYGPWGQPGISYPKVTPNGQVPLGASQLVTDFDGHNHKTVGSWSFNLPANAREIWIATQGDAPARVTWTGSKLVFETSAEVTSKAPKALDNAPMPSAGSSGISVVVYVK